MKGDSHSAATSIDQSGGRFNSVKIPPIGRRQRRKSKASTCQNFPSASRFAATRLFDVVYFFRPTKGWNFQQSAKIGRLLLSAPGVASRSRVSYSWPMAVSTCESRHQLRDSDDNKTFEVRANRANDPPPTCTKANISPAARNNQTTKSIRWEPGLGISTWPHVPLNNWRQLLRHSSKISTSRSIGCLLGIPAITPAANGADTVTVIGQSDSLVLVTGETELPTTRLNGFP